MDNNFPNYKGGFYAVNDWTLYCGHKKVALFGPLGINIQEEILDCLNGKNNMETKLTNIHKEFFHNATAIQCREGRLFNDIYAINKKRGSGSATDEEIADWIINRLSNK